MVLGTAKRRHRKSISWPTTRGRDVSKRIFMEFTIASDEIQYIVIRNSKLAGQSRSASRWTNWHRKTFPIAHPLRSTRDKTKTGMSHWTNQAEMHRWNSDQTSEKQSQLWTVSTGNLVKSDLNQSLFINTKGWHSSSSSSTSWWQWNENWWSSYFQEKVVERSFTADGKLLQPTGVWTEHLTRHIFSCLHVCWTVSHVTLAQGVVRVIPSMSHALVCLTSLRLSTLHSSRSLSSSTSSSWSSTSPSMWVGSERIPLCASANEESDPLVNNAPLTLAALFGS